MTMYILNDEVINFETACKHAIETGENIFRVAGSTMQRKIVIVDYTPITQGYCKMHMLMHCVIGDKICIEVSALKVNEWQEIDLLDDIERIKESEKADLERKQKALRDTKARQYSLECKAKENRKIAILGICAIIFFWVAILITGKSDFETAVAEGKVKLEETTEVVTEMETEIIAEVETTEPYIEPQIWFCRVVEVYDDLVTVEYKGEWYNFFGTGYKVGHELTCLVTYDFVECEWQIIKALNLKPTEKAEVVLVGIDTDGNYIVSFADGTTKIISDPPEVWYTVELDANHEIIGIVE